MKKALDCTIHVHVVVLVTVALAVGEVRAGSPAATLEVMQQELERNMKSLKVPDYPSPYFISYLVRDVQMLSVTARFGAVVDREDDRTRLVFVDVRVGSPEFDNTLDRYPGMDTPFVFKPLKDRIPLDDDPAALRKVLWSATDMEYKAAAASYLKVKAQRIYRAEDPEFSGCFTPAPKVEHIDRRAPFPSDITPYEKTVVDLSSRLANVEFIHDSWVSFDATAYDRYFVNSEGTRFYTSETFFSFRAVAYSRAKDGSVVEHSLVECGRSIEGLPSRKELVARVDTLVTELDALRKAPVLPPYNGPALLMADTAGVYLHEALGHRLEGHRQEDGEEGGTFRHKIGQQVLPETISVYDDPTLERFGGVELNGHYLLDDEGVRSSRVVLVKDGRLSGFLTTRKPVDKFRNSNGHARGSGTQRPVARMGNLILETTAPVPVSEMKKRLLELARSQGKSFAVILRTGASGATNTSSWGFQAFKGLSRLVYKVDAETGEETLVRGVELVGTPLASLMKIVAVGDDPAVFNGYCEAESGWVPVTSIVPSLLLTELELQKSPPNREQPEIVPPPRLDSQYRASRAVYASDLGSSGGRALGHSGLYHDRRRWGTHNLDTGGGAGKSLHGALAPMRYNPTWNGLAFQVNAAQHFCEFRNNCKTGSQGEFEAVAYGNLGSDGVRSTFIMWGKGIEVAKDYRANTFGGSELSSKWNSACVP